MRSNWFQNLSEREQSMIEMRRKGLVYHEIASAHGVSRARVPQIIEAAQLRKEFHVDRNSPEHFYLTERFHSPRLT